MKQSKVRNNPLVGVVSRFFSCILAQLLERLYQIQSLKVPYNNACTIIEFRRTPFETQLIQIQIINDELRIFCRRLAFENGLQGVALRALRRNALYSRQLRERVM